MENVIDKNKVIRERRKNRSSLARQEFESPAPIHVIYFDGKKDLTLESMARGPKQCHKTEKQEHYTILEEPGSKYLGHVSPRSGSAADITDEILKFIEDKNVDLVAAGCDGTVVNTGYKSGIIARLEQHIGRNVNWLVCLLHGNELPLRHLIIELDGKPKGPTSFPGPIGQSLNSCQTLPVVAFKQIEAEAINIDIHDLSIDQKYRLCHKEGHADPPPSQK